MWADRTAEMEEVDPSTLREHPDNWRLHSDEQLAILSRILGDLGQIGGIIASKRSRLVLNGHARLRLAIDQGVRRVLVQWVDVTEEEERRVLATFDSVAAMRDTRKEQLLKLVEDEEVARLSRGIDLLDALRDPPLEGLHGRGDPDQTGEEGGQSEPVARNQAWYVYSKAAIGDDVMDWLVGVFGDVDGITVGYAE